MNGSDFVEWFAEEGRRVYGDLVAPTTNDRRWCGVVWCDVVWCGVVWCGVVVMWCGADDIRRDDGVVVDGGVLLLVL